MEDLEEKIDVIVDDLVGSKVELREFLNDYFLQADKVIDLENQIKKIKDGNYGLSQIINSKRKEINNYKQQLELIKSDTYYEGNDVSVIHVIRKRAEKTLKGDFNNEL